MKETLEEKKTRILSDLAAVRRAILEAAGELRGERREQVFLGTWTIKDLIAHLVGWDYANLQAVGALQVGKLPEFYAHIGKDWADFNALLVSRYKREDFSRLLADAWESHRCLAEAAGQVTGENFDCDWQVRYKGYKVTISRLLQAEARDEQAHLEQIRAFCGRSCQ